MKIIIELKNKKEIMATMDENEYNEIKEKIASGIIKMIEVNGGLVSVDSISNIIIQKEPEHYFALPDAPRNKDAEKKGMEKLGNFFKRKGYYEKFNTYDEWKGRNNQINKNIK